ncbi:unnamed protein product [Taphrina deformans PYCC 5710]|uniref:FAD-binding PCMH-type domain-containing protein n=1 Tax=Taphrina deformans (strain PYCC 5710 / ATCC 11124 / CBS 356.35 / IMI 108563 / JCM 9778 / NBRC 8474) TaxID=1097556 RepID=R4XGU1_TAPDE|nr:unnamed protein product [Taphrina deformans PYCC 5710]|eukprot:CCG84902.1 unnamed protein product [Taphrina deformans PYCC 5710]
MVGVNHPLASFPSEATCETLNTKVAQRSVNGNKRRRFGGNQSMPSNLASLSCYDDHASTFRPKDPLEVSSILKLTSEHNFTASVLNSKGTGTHGDARGGEIVIDLSSRHFQRIEIDHDAMTVTVGGGVTSRMLDIALCSESLTTPLVGYTVGLGAFLSGGFGFSSRLHGLTVDNILDVEVVLADGSVLHANAYNHIDLFWALKGCGTGFGVITGLKLRCYPLVNSVSANIIFPFERSTAADLMKHWRDCLEGVPDEVYSNFVMAAGPAASEPVAILQICHLGDEDVGMPIIDRMAAFSGTKYHFKDCGEITYLRQQELVEAVLKGAAVEKSQTPENQVKYLLDGNVLADLTDEVIEESSLRFLDEAPAGSIWCFELFGGSLAKTTDNCIPSETRAGKFHAASILRVPADDQDAWHNDEAGRDWIRSTISKVTTGGPLPSFLPTSSTDAREAKRYHDVIRGSYGHENWSRLKKLKKQYDSKNCFRYGFDAGMLGLEEQLVDGL